MTDPRVESAAPLRILPSGSGAILVELPDLADTMALLADLQAEPLHGVLEMVAGARTLSLRFDPHVTSATDLTSALALRRLRPPRPESQRTVEIPVRYDGEDLAEVARLTGLSETEVIRRHTQSPWTVAFGGFAPGFAYLSGGDRDCMKAGCLVRRACPVTQAYARMPEQSAYHMRQFHK